MFGKAAPVTLLGYAAIFLTGLMCATLIAEHAAAADLTIPVSPKTEATGASAPNGARLYQDFLKWLESHPAR
jgi:hypothetical protein